MHYTKLIGTTLIVLLMVGVPVEADGGDPEDGNPDPFGLRRAIMEAHESGSPEPILRWVNDTAQVARGYVCLAGMPATPVEEVVVPEIDAATSEPQQIFVTPAPSEAIRLNGTDREPRFLRLEYHMERGGNCTITDYNYGVVALSHQFDPEAWLAWSMQ